MLIPRKPSKRGWPIAGLLALLALTTAPAAHAVDPDLVKYATECRAKIPIDIPPFSCMSGTVIPMVGTEGKGGKCDKPPYLPKSRCYENSRIGDLGSTDKVGLVFLCRHKETVGVNVNNNWQDIAIVQTNFDTGATCFYQQLENGSGLSGDVQSPVTGEGPWITPKEMATLDHACVQCHDNGPLVRTPYVMQVANQVPIFAHFEERNKNELLRAKYWFPGAEFLFYDPPTNSKNWNGNVLSVKDSTAATCVSCHAMGVNNLDKDYGTSTWLGLMATGFNPTKYMQNGAGFEQNRAYWMRPGLTKPSPLSTGNSDKFSQCAKKAVGTGACSHELFEGQITALTELSQKLLREKTATAATPAPEPARPSTPSQWRDH